MKTDEIFEKPMKTDGIFEKPMKTDEIFDIFEIFEIFEIFDIFGAVRTLAKTPIHPAIQPRRTPGWTCTDT